MFNAMIAGLAMCFSVSAFAGGSFANALYRGQQLLMRGQTGSLGLQWKVGDENDYTIALGFLRGTMIAKVTSITADGIWMSQDIDLASAGKQKVESLIDENTGETKKLIVNGKEEPVPKSDFEVVEAVNDTVKVPAGTFPCLRAKLKDKGTNEIVQMWVNQAQIPLSGMIKTIQPTQLGDATISLVRFKKN